DVKTPARTLVQAVSVQCPETPVVCIAGTLARQRLIESFAHRAVSALVPKLGSWLEVEAISSSEGPDEQELGVALKRLSARALVPHGPTPYLIGTSAVEERLIVSSHEKEEALQAVLNLAHRLSLSDEKLRRIEVATDELLLNALFAPRAVDGKLRFA